MRETLNERVYRLVKTEVTEGRFPPGTRIDVPQLSDRHATSLTPVRMTLIRLVGEGLVELHANEGFYLPRVTEPGLRDLHDWQSHLLVTAVRAQEIPLKGLDLSGFWRAYEAQSPLASEVMASAIASTSPNAELRHAADRVSDQLRKVRLITPASTEGLLSTLALNIEAGNAVAAIKTLGHYCKQKKEQAPALVRQLYLGSAGGVP